MSTTYSIIWNSAVRRTDSSEQKYRFSNDFDENINSTKREEQKNQKKGFNMSENVKTAYKIESREVERNNKEEKKCYSLGIFVRIFHHQKCRFSKIKSGRTDQESSKKISR